MEDRHEETKLESLPLNNFSPDKDEVEVVQPIEELKEDWSKRMSYPPETLGEVAAEMEEAEKELYHNM